MTQALLRWNQPQYHANASGYDWLARPTQITDPTGAVVLSTGDGHGLCTHKVGAFSIGSSK